MKNLKKLLVVAFPNRFGRETVTMGILGVFLVARTFLSIRISEVNGLIVKAIVDRNLSLVS